MQMLGKIIILFGIVMVFLGLGLYFGANLSFFGKLPGDIRVERPNFSFYFPITTCILLSLVLTLLLYILSRFR